MKKANLYYARIQAGIGLLLIGALVIGLRGQYLKIADNHENNAKKDEQNAENNRQVAETIVKHLHSAKTSEVTGILEEINGDHKWVVYQSILDEYKRLFRTDLEKRLNVTVALVSLVPEQSKTVEDLFNQLLNAEPDEVLMTKNVLENKFTVHDDMTVGSDLWTNVKTSEERDVRLRAAALLANFNSESSNWEQTIEDNGTTVSVAIVDDLVHVDDQHKETWIELFKPISKTILQPLITVFVDATNSDKRRLAACFLTNYLKDKPSELAKLLKKADAAQYAVIYPTFVNNNEMHLSKATRVLSNAIDDAVTLIEANDPRIEDDILSDSIKTYIAQDGVHANRAQLNAQYMEDTEVIVEILLSMKDGVGSQGLVKLTADCCILKNQNNVSQRRGEHPITILKKEAAKGMALVRCADVIIGGFHERILRARSSIGHDVVFDRFQATREKAKDAQSKEAANAAVVLLKTGRAKHAWQLLKHRPDPRIRSFLIHRFEPLGVVPEMLSKQFVVEPDISIRRALLMSLGEYNKEAVPNVRLTKMVGDMDLVSLYQVSTDPGLHAGIEWLLRQWELQYMLDEGNDMLSDNENENIRLEKIKEDARTRKGDSERTWYLNRQRHTMVVFPAPVTFWMGTRKDEFESEAGEPYRCWKINKPFAIASTLVTVQQFKESNVFDSYGWESIEGTEFDDPELPIIGVSWHQAAAYCNWLSQEEGISKDQWCYRVDWGEKLDEKNGIWRPNPVATAEPDYARRTGYRLPTEIEWEYAARADARTARFFGQTKELMEKYAWFNKNYNDEPKKVGLLKPNDFGLFDMLGNKSQWCHEPYNGSGPMGNASEICVVAYDTNLKRTKSDVSDNSEIGALRGGSHMATASEVRVARRADNRRDADWNHYGFRVARYLLECDE